MAITLITTPGAINANSYPSLAEANAYTETLLHATDWLNSNDDNKKAALVWATRILDQQIDWYATRATETQSLRIPAVWKIDDPDGYEISETIVPQFVKNATSELAKHLITSDRTLEADTFGYKRMRAGQLELEMQKYEKLPVIPDSVWQMVQYYGEKRSSSRKLLRV